MTIRKDLVLHFIVGVVLGAVGWWLESPLAGILLAAVVGAAKEVVWDLALKRGTPDYWDFFWTAVGGVVVCVWGL